MKEQETWVNKEKLNNSIIQKLQPRHYDQWRDLAANAWRGVGEINKSWDFTALTKDNLCSLGIFNGEQMLGASLNILKINAEGWYLLVHQLGIHVDYQGQGLGKKMMDANFATCNKLEIPTIKLTSDPLDSKNMRLYFHKCRMFVSEYLPDAYQNLSETGAEKHRGLPSDRLYFFCHPKSRWAQEGQMPSQEKYQELLRSHPELLYGRMGNELAFVETPVNLEQLLTTDSEKAFQWRIQQRKIFEGLFNYGYTAVDHIFVDGKENDKQHFTVCFKNFDEEDPYCLIKTVQGNI